MDRAERRYRTEKVAKRRLYICPDHGEGQKLGWFRKWNLTYRCRMCLISKYCDTQFQRWKDERRNLLPE